MATRSWFRTLIDKEACRPFCGISAPFLVPDVIRG